MLKSLNDITPDILTMIEAAAKVFFVPAEISFLLEIEPTFFNDEVTNPESQLYRAFYKGRLTGEFELRQCILKLAMSGSSPAQTMATEILKESKLKMPRT